MEVKVVKNSAFLTATKLLLHKIHVTRFKMSLALTNSVETIFPQIVTKTVSCTLLQLIPAFRLIWFKGLYQHPHLP